MNWELSPVKRNKREAMQAYNRLSRWYDLLTYRSEKKFKQIGLDLLKPQSGERILEIGPGTGHSLLALSERCGPLGDVHGLDISPGMLRITHQRLITSGKNQAPFHLVMGDGAAPPYSASSFDAIFSSFTLELFDSPEIPRVLAACRRLMGPGGRICLVSLARPDRPSFIVKLYEWAHNQWPAYIDCRPIPLTSMLEESGFSIVSRQKHSIWGLPIEIALAVPQNSSV